MYERDDVVVPARPAPGAERVESVAEDPYAHRRGAAEKLRQAVLLVFTIINGLIAIRFVLRVFGANQDAPFAAFVYGITAPFLAPFFGLFGTPRVNGSAVEWFSLVAIVAYMLLAWVLAKIIWILAGETRRATRAEVNRVES
jgi:hypothetical protein